MGIPWRFHGLSKPRQRGRWRELRIGSVSLRFRQQTTSGSTMTLAETEKPAAVNEEGRLSN
jgi:hypothetical protein